MEETRRLRSVAEAKAVIEECMTPDGFRAGLGQYPQLWIRDLAYSEGALLDLGYGAAVRRHLESFVRLQRKNGNIPTVVASGLTGALSQRFHSWTCDSEVLFVLAAHEYARYTRDTGFLDSIGGPIRRCADFVGGRLDGFGLIRGSDWRDAVPGLERSSLLSNQVQLIDMYLLLGERERAEALRETVREVFALRDLGFLADAVSWHDGKPRRDPRFDCLGSAIGVVNGTVGGDLLAGTLEGFKGADSPFGYRNVSPPYAVNRGYGFRAPDTFSAYVRTGAWLRNRVDHYQNSAIWPFVEARVVTALRKAGLTSEAEAASERMLARRGMYEWYSPVDGERHGSAGQLWTAAAVISQG